MKSRALILLLCLPLLSFAKNSEHDLSEDLWITPHLPSEQKIEINLKNPLLKGGVLSTQEGGIIIGPNLRVQARHIEYIDRIENGAAVKRLKASKDLLVQFGQRAFAAESLEYDFVTKSGSLTKGRTFVGLWFIGGEKIELKPDGTFVLDKAFVTTSESQDFSWGIHAMQVKIQKKNQLFADNVSFRAAKTPFFWVPALKSNLKKISDSPIRYKLTWDKGLGPRLTARYRFYSWHEFEAFFRVDYRISRGWGGAVETDYKHPHHKMTFRTRAYGAHDKEYPDEPGKHRYRLQGVFHYESQDERTLVHATADKMSDYEIVNVFQSEDFEINTEKITRVYAKHQTDDMLGIFNFRPWINSFQSLNQQLPRLVIDTKPIPLGSSGIIFEGLVDGAYLDYKYAKDLQDVLLNINAGRLCTKGELYRPIPLGPVSLTPRAGFIGIYYSNNPPQQTPENQVGQAIFHYGGTLKTTLIGTAGAYTHILEPYAEYLGLTPPKANLGNTPIFSLDDGYFRLNQLKLGINNQFYLPKKRIAEADVSCDMYAYAFFAENTYQLLVPKGYLDVTWRRSFLSLVGGFCWNFNEDTLDYSNIRADVTLSSHVAFGVEFRHRSRFDWKKANHKNFILDAARTIDSLLETPLSDGRNTLLARAFIRLSPVWTCHINSYFGWGRKNEPRYNTVKADLFRVLSSSWRLKISYQHLPNDDRFSASLSVIK